MNEDSSEAKKFLRRSEWRDCEVIPLPGDASFRRYFRIRKGEQTAMLMHAPPPHEDVGPFLNVARWLHEKRLRAPSILAEDRDAGFIILEDFGNTRMREYLDENPQDEEAIYARAVDTLLRLHRMPPAPLPPYDLETYQREARLFVEWYCPYVGIEADVKAFEDAWTIALEPLLRRQSPGVTVLRDYHAENIMLLNPGGTVQGEQGLIDFQDALVGHPAYDLVSLLQDARRDVSPELERKMIARYRSEARPEDDFEADYARLGAQRNTKIVGIFARLAERDRKPRYLAMIPRVWRQLERDLEHDALTPVREWFDANIPQNIRDNAGGELR